MIKGSKSECTQGRGQFDHAERYNFGGKTSFTVELYVTLDGNYSVRSKQA